MIFMSSVELDAFIRNPNHYRPARTKQRIMWCSMPMLGSIFDNKFTEAKIRTDPRERFVLAGFEGEYYTIDAVTLSKTYTFADGTAITADALREKLDGDTIPWFQVQSISGIEYFALCVPAEYSFKMPVKNGVESGNVANVPHGKGDFIVCQRNGDLRFINTHVINGFAFAQMFNNQGWDMLVDKNSPLKVVKPEFKFETIKGYEACLRILTKGAATNITGVSDEAIKKFVSTLMTARKKMRVSSIPDVIKVWMQAIDKIWRKTGEILEGYDRKAYEIPITLITFWKTNTWAKRFESGTIYRNLLTIGQRGAYTFDYTLPVGDDYLMNMRMKIETLLGDRTKSGEANIVISNTHTHICPSMYLEQRKIDEGISDIGFKLSLQEFVNSYSEDASATALSIEQYIEAQAKNIAKWLMSFFTLKTGFRTAVRLTKLYDEYTNYLSYFSDVPAPYGTMMTAVQKDAIYLRETEGSTLDKLADVFTRFNRCMESNGHKVDADLEDVESTKLVSALYTSGFKKIMSSAAQVLNGMLPQDICKALEHSAEIRDSSTSDYTVEVSMTYAEAGKGVALQHTVTCATASLVFETLFSDNVVTTLKTIWTSTGENGTVEKHDVGCRVVSLCRLVKAREDCNTPEYILQQSEKVCSAVSSTLGEQILRSSYETTRAELAKLYKPFEATAKLLGLEANAVIYQRLVAEGTVLFPNDTWRTMESVDKALNGKPAYVDLQAHTMACNTLISLLRPFTERSKEEIETMRRVGAKTQQKFCKLICDSLSIFFIGLQSVLQTTDIPKELISNISEWAMREQYSAWHVEPRYNKSSFFCLSYSYSKVYDKKCLTMVVNVSYEAEQSLSIERIRVVDAETDNVLSELTPQQIKDRGSIKVNRAEIIDRIESSTTALMDLGDLFQPVVASTAKLLLEVWDDANKVVELEANGFNF